MIAWCAQKRAEWHDASKTLRDAGAITAAEFVEHDIKVLATIEAALTEAVWREAQR